MTATRVGALLVLLIAPVALEPAIDAHGYSIVLMVAVALGAVVSSRRLWHTGDAWSHAAAAALAGTVLVGQVTVATFGGPTDATPHWSAAAAALTVVTAAALIALGAGVRTASQISTRKDAHPYAL